MYVFYIRLQEGEGFLLLPGPHGGIEGLAGVPFLGRSSSPQDVSDGVRRKTKSVGTQVEGEAMPAVASLLPGFKHLLLDLGRRYLRRGVGPAGAIPHARHALGLVARNPLAHHLSRGVPAPGRLADAACLTVGHHQLQSCLRPGHSVNCPVGQVCHRCGSSWRRCCHHSSTRGTPDLANICLTTW